MLQSETAETVAIVLEGPRSIVIFTIKPFVSCPTRYALGDQTTNLVVFELHMGAAIVLVDQLIAGIVGREATPIDQMGLEPLAKVILDVVVLLLGQAHVTTELPVLVNHNLGMVALEVHVVVAVGVE